MLRAERVKVLAYIQSIVRRFELAEDIYQDVCALAVEKSALIENEAHLSNWLRTTARFQSLNAIRSRQEQQESLGDEVFNLLDPIWEQEDSVHDSDHAEALGLCMAELSAKNQELIRKRYVLGLGYSELATELNRTTQSLYSAFNRLHSALAECISARLGTEERSCNG